MHHKPLWCSQLSSYIPLMPLQPFASLTASKQGLFSPEELRSLMEKELSRSKRYDYEMVLLSIGVDRIDSLGDIYGHDSKAHVIEEIVSLLTASTRSCDYLGCLMGDRILALFPHTTEVGARSISNRLLAASRELEFSADGPQVSITVTVGIAEPDKDHDLETLIYRATEACREGQEAGGDRWRAWEAPSPTTDQSAPDLTKPDPTTMSALMDEMLKAKMRKIFESMGEQFPDLAGRDSEVLALALKKMTADRDDQDEKLEVLERRIARLSHNLGLTDDQLQHAMEVGFVDTGIASISNGTQGTSDDNSEHQLKKDMMAAIYEANKEILQETENEQDK